MKTIHIKYVAGPAQSARSRANRTSSLTAQPRMTDHARPIPEASRQAKSTGKTSRPARALPSASLARDITAVFRLEAPLAQSVKLAGEFTQWEKLALNMKQGRNGVWEIEVALAPGRHFYRFLVDGQWQDDPLCTRREPNPFGTNNAVIEVR